MSSFPTFRFFTDNFSVGCLEDIGFPVFDFKLIGEQGWGGVDEEVDIGLVGSFSPCLKSSLLVKENFTPG